MYQNTRFNDLLKALPRTQFDRTVSQFGNDKHNKGLRSWDQFVSMVYAQLTGRTSLRELETSFNANAQAHYHLGTRKVKRSSLSRANNQRDYQLYESLCQQLISQLKGRKKRELKEQLGLLDSTPISLKGLGYDDWAGDHKTQHTQGLKLHMVYDLKSEFPIYNHLSYANVNDINDAHTMPLERDVTYVFDKGYCDYNWWHKIHCQGSLFVTRFKNNAAVEIIEQKEVDGNVLEDSVAQFKYSHPRGGRKNQYTSKLRRVVVEREGHSTPLVIATNDHHRSAQQLADLYRSRWQIELFFKWLKQNLKIKRFMGRSENAVRTQIYIAIITYLLVYQFRATHGLECSLKMCLVDLSATLLERPKLIYRAHRKRKKEALEFASKQPSFSF